MKALFDPNEVYLSHNITLMETGLWTVASFGSTLQVMGHYTLTIVCLGLQIKTFYLRTEWFSFIILQRISFWLLLFSQLHTAQSLLGDLNPMYLYPRQVVFLICSMDTRVKSNGYDHPILGTPSAWFAIWVINSLLELRSIGDKKITDLNICTTSNLCLLS